MTTSGWDITSVRFRIGTIRRWKLAPRYSRCGKKIWRNAFQCRAYQLASELGPSSSRMKSLADCLQDHIDQALAEMAKAGITWSAERQAAYNAACVRFYRASVAKDDSEKQAALAIVRAMETEGGLL